MSNMRSLCRIEKKELKVLASDFGLLDLEEVQEIIDSCGSYAEGRRAIMKVYDRVYMC